jgi:hypothetical protein
MQPAMPGLTVKGLPEPLLQRLGQSAQANRRSLNGEVLYRREQAMENRVTEPEQLLAQARALGARSSLTPLTDEVLRRMRDEGRP